MTDIVERLREHGSKTEMEAAAEIERLRDENELLRDTKGCTILDMKEEIERLQADIAAIKRYG